MSRRTWKTVSIELMCEELRAAGWTTISRCVWRAPDGGFYRGPYGAYRAMKSMGEDAKIKTLRANTDAPSSHVAYLRWAGDGEHKYLVLCDSDAEGAFKVYRRQTQGDQ
jgi:hypothetical protein